MPLAGGLWPGTVFESVPFLRDPGEIALQAPDVVGLGANMLDTFAGREDCFYPT